VVVESNERLAEETTLQSAGQVGQLRGDPILARAVGYTLDLLGNFHEETGHNPRFVRSGSVHLALSPARAKQFEQLHRVAQQIGYPTRAISVAEARELVPDLITDSVHAALYVPRDGYVDAPAGALAYASAAADRGVTIRTGCMVTSMERQDQGDGCFVLYANGQPPIQVKKLILAGGPWTRLLSRHLGYEVPMHPIRLQQARTVAAGVSPDHPVVRVPDASCYVRPEKQGYLFGFFDPDPLPIDLDEQPYSFRTSSVAPEPALTARAQQALAKVFRRLPEQPIDQFRQGMMTCTPDGKFVLGPIPPLPGVWVATGCGGTGIAASGAVGKWLAQWVVGEDPGEDLRQYAVDRFGDRHLDRTWLRTSACATSAAYYRLPPDAT
jgi:glycine/D-amino acid oxidase-like deaminating enzyme